MSETPTIFALSTAPGRAGVAVVRLSGPGAGTALDKMTGGRPPSRYASLRKIRSMPEGDVIDEALVLWFPAPRSETGEDMAEFQVHGSRAVVQAIFRSLGALPEFRLAEPGEFARRAFLNGRMDLTAVEGLADLIDAETEAQRRQALVQAQGGLGRLYDGWRSRLIEAMALVEAAIDFSEEADVSSSAVAQALSIVEPLRLKIDRHLADANRGEIVRSGFRVVLAGAPNVGKSSLLNALARRDVAIVSEEAGTTRDVIEVRLDIAGLAISMSDTAGLRETSGVVEREGMRRTLARAEDADLVLWIMDAAKPDPAVPPALAALDGAGRVWRVANKTDLVAIGSVDADHFVSAVTGAGLDQLVAGIAQTADARLARQPADDPVPTVERHRNGLQRSLAHLERFIHETKGDVELRAEDLRLAAQELGRLTGRVDADEVLGQIFSRFCIGK